MTSGSPQHLETEDPSRSQDATVARGWIAWSSLLFAFLQSVCTLLAAIAGLRLAIGVGSLALSAEAGALLVRIHADWIRSPMISLAIMGSLLNLIAITRLRRLRKRPASHWRQTPISVPRARMEKLQMILSLAVLALIVAEECFHLRYLHTL
jgi:hypothetical protein